MQLNKDTLKFLSISCSPGNFGTTIYNSIFQQYKINAVYLPVQLAKDRKPQFAQIMMSLRYLNIAGVSISMPFKGEAARISSNHKRILNVNTLIPLEQGWKSFNTDTIGFEKACMQFIKEGAETAHIAGYGCAAHSISRVLMKYGVKSRMFDVRDGMKTDTQADWFINATPIGMDDTDESVFEPEHLKKYKYVFDAVVRPPKTQTKLIAHAKDLNIPHVEGYKMSMHQLIAQFQIYANNWQMPISDLDIQLEVEDIMKQDMGYEI